MTKLNEYNEQPKWIDTLTDEERYAKYLEIKQTLHIFQKLGDATALEQAIADYEKRHGLV
jgi:hypothetical protein